MLKKIPNSLLCSILLFTSHSFSLYAGLDAYRIRASRLGRTLGGCYAVVIDPVRTIGSLAQEEDLDTIIVRAFFNKAGQNPEDGEPRGEATLRTLQGKVIKYDSAFARLGQKHHYSLVAYRINPITKQLKKFDVFSDAVSVRRARAKECRLLGQYGPLYLKTILNKNDRVALIGLSAVGLYALGGAAAIGGSLYLDYRKDMNGRKQREAKQQQRRLEQQVQAVRAAQKAEWVKTPEGKLTAGLRKAFGTQPSQNQEFNPRAQEEESRALQQGSTMLGKELKRQFGSPRAQEEEWGEYESYSQPIPPVFQPNLPAGWYQGEPPLRPVTNLQNFRLPQGTIPPPRYFQPDFSKDPYAQYYEKAKN